MKFLVLGGAGYVGSHFVAEAQRQGHHCAVVDNLSRGFRESVHDALPFYKTDILATDDLVDILHKEQPDCILHYAAFALVPESVANPQLYYRNNVLGTQSVLKAIAKIDATTPFVFSSTCAVYGIPTVLPIIETTKTAPISPYGESKLTCENNLRLFAEQHPGARITALRYFNACGADRDGHIGEAHEPETHLIPNLLRAAQSNTPVTIFGDDFPTPDGSCVRDYIHVTDLAHAHLSAASQMVDGKAVGFRVFNLGTGSGYSNFQILHAAREVTGLPIPHIVGDRRDGDPAELVADAGLAKNVLAFQPRFSALQTILSSAWVWHQSHPRGFKP